MAYDLKYWKDGEPIIPSSSASTKELKYWLDGIPFTNITAGGSPPSSAIKTINGLAKASVKTVKGLAIASVKTINGLA